VEPSEERAKLERTGALEICLTQKSWPVRAFVECTLLFSSTQYTRSSCGETFASTWILLELFFVHISCMSYVKPIILFADVPPNAIGLVGLLLRARLAAGANHTGSARVTEAVAVASLLNWLILSPADPIQARNWFREVVMYML
jgi:hypothetical protein